MTALLSLKIRYEQDVVLTRQSARQLAELLEFDTQDQARLATAVSEIARNAFQYAGEGTVDFWVETADLPMLRIQVSDRGPGIPRLEEILAGRSVSTTGMGLGILGSKRLMDQFEIESSASQGTTVRLGKALPKRATALTPLELDQIRAQITDRSPQNPFEEIQRQNQELLQAMAELQRREEELVHLNRELEDTNRGVVALYAELDEKAVSLQKANELKTRFLSNMSHEFRTPLNSIVSLSHILLDRLDGDLNGEQEKQVTFIKKAAEDLTDLVNNLLDLAKVEAGKIVVHPSQFEVSELFGTLRGMLRPLLAHNSAIALVLEEPIGIPTLHTDEGKVAQILRNFISNALKFTEQGSVRVTAALERDWVTFSVADTGIGIAPADQQRIFEDFVQIDSSLQKKVKGTGLGLPLSRQLAALLGGRVAVTSQLGQGATFSVSMPIVAPGLRSSRPWTASTWTASTWPNHPTGAVVLVVEDNPETLFAYEKFFQQSIYQFLAAQTLDQAKQSLETCQPVAILLDILLGDHHTWTWLSDLKSNAATRDIPIVVATVVDNERQALALGADGFLIKPVDRFALLNKINTLVRCGKSQKLLVIDDELPARYVLTQRLANDSLELLEATQAQEGLRLARTEQPAAIVLDLNMPESSGFEILQQLQHDPATQNIPVIISTAKLLEPEEQQQLAAHSVAILTKGTFAQAETETQLRQALIKAGIALEPGGTADV